MTGTAALEVLCCPTAVVDARLLAEYEALLSRDEFERLGGFRSPAAAKEFLIGRALLRSALGERLRRLPAGLRFTRDPDGKPQLEGEPGHLHFNLSHSRDWVVLALSNFGEVGVDVEHHERTNNLQGIAGRFFSAAENLGLDALADAPRRQRFFELWTIKEAYVKALGRGIATALAGTDIRYLSNSEIALYLSGAACIREPAMCWHYQLTPDNSLAVAAFGATLQDGQRPLLFSYVPRSVAPQPILMQPLRRGEAICV